ncbi:MAG: hypothetical protein WC889_15530, partial [Myxococcota bacterium]
PDGTRTNLTWQTLNTGLQDFSLYPPCPTKTDPGYVANVNGNIGDIHRQNVNYQTFYYLDNSTPITMHVENTNSPGTFNDFATSTYVLRVRVYWRHGGNTGNTAMVGENACAYVEYTSTVDCNNFGEPMPGGCGS